MRADKLERAVTRSSENAGQRGKTGEKASNKEHSPKSGSDSKEGKVREGRDRPDRADKGREHSVKEKGDRSTKEKVAAEPRGKETRAAPVEKGKRGENASRPQRESPKAKGGVGKQAAPEKQAITRSEKARGAVPEKSGGKNKAGAEGKAAAGKGAQCETAVREVLDRTAKSPKGQLAAKDRDEIMERCAASLGPGSDVIVNDMTTEPGDIGEKAKNQTSRAEVEVTVVNRRTGESLTVVGRRDPYSARVRTEGMYYNGKEDRYETFADGKSTGRGRGLGKQPQSSTGSRGGGGVPIGMGTYNPDVRTIYFDPNQMSWQSAQDSGTGHKGRTATPPGKKPEAQPDPKSAKESRDRPEREPPYKDRSHNPYKDMFEDMGSVAKLGQEIQTGRAKLAAVKILDRAKYLQRKRIFDISRSKSLREAREVVSETSKSGQAMKSFAGSVKRLGYLGDAITIADIGVDVYLAPEGTGAKTGVQRVASELVKIGIGAGVGVVVVASLPVTASATLAVVTIGAASVIATEVYSRAPVATDIAGNDLSTSEVVEAMAGDIYDSLAPPLP